MTKEGRDNRETIEMLVPGFCTIFPREIPFGEITVGKCYTLLKEEGICFSADGDKNVVIPQEDE